MADTKLSFADQGKLMAQMVQLQTAIRNRFEHNAVPPDVMDWLFAPRNFSLQNAIDEIAMDYFAEKIIARVDGYTITVNLNAAPMLPHKNARIIENDVTGQLVLESRRDGLFINGRQVELIRSEHFVDRKDAVVSVKSTRQAAGEVYHLCDNVAFALRRFPHLYPGSWTLPLSNGDSKYVVFAKTVFHYDHYPAVRALHWEGSHVHGGQIEWEMFPYEKNCANHPGTPQAIFGGRPRGVFYLPVIKGLRLTP